MTSLSDGESYEIARYMADKLLQYDRSFGSMGLVYSDPALQTPEPEGTETPAAAEMPSSTEAPSAAHTPAAGDKPGDVVPDSEDNAQDNTVTADWSEFFTTDDWVITYSSYDTCKTYPEKSDIYQVTASKGKKLLVISFDVINKTGHKIDIDLTEAGLKYQLHIGNESYEPMISILDNGGLMFLNVKLKPHGQDKAVLIFNVPEGADLSAMRLDVSR